MSNPVIEARELTQIYPVKQGLFRAPAQLQAVNKVSFAVEAGRTLAVVGESGCGKSTLARMATLIGTCGARWRTVRTIRIELSSRPADTRTVRALAIWTSTNVSSFDASPCNTLQPAASAAAMRGPDWSITTMQAGSVPRAMSSRTASAPLVP